MKWGESRNKEQTKNATKVAPTHIFFVFFYYLHSDNSLSFSLSFLCFSISFASFIISLEFYVCGVWSARNRKHNLYLFFHRKLTITWASHWWIRWVMPTYPIALHGWGQSKTPKPAYANADPQKARLWFFISHPMVRLTCRFMAKWRE